MSSDQESDVDAFDDFLAVKNEAEESRSKPKTKRMKEATKSNHSIQERKRRDRVNRHFQELDALCITVDKSFMSKRRDRDCILVNAIAVVKRLKAIIREGGMNGAPKGSIESSSLNRTATPLTSTSSSSLEADSSQSPPSASGELTKLAPVPDGLSYPRISRPPSLPRDALPMSDVIAALREPAQLIGLNSTQSIAAPQQTMSLLHGSPICFVSNAPPPAFGPNLANPLLATLSSAFATETPRSNAMPLSQMQHHLIQHQFQQQNAGLNGQPLLSQPEDAFRRVLQREGFDLGPLQTLLGLSPLGTQQSQAASPFNPEYPSRHSEVHPSYVGAGIKRRAVVPTERASASGMHECILQKMSVCVMDAVGVITGANTSALQFLFADASSCVLDDMNAFRNSILPGTMNGIGPPTHISDAELEEHAKAATEKLPFHRCLLYFIHPEEAMQLCNTLFGMIGGQGAPSYLRLRLRKPSCPEEAADFQFVNSRPVHYVSVHMLLCPKKDGLHRLEAVDCAFVPA